MVKVDADRVSATLEPIGIFFGATASWTAAVLWSLGECVRVLGVIPVGGNHFVHAAGVTFGEKEVVEIKLLAVGLADENVGELTVPFIGLRLRDQNVRSFFELHLNDAFGGAAFGRVQFRRVQAAQAHFLL